MFVIYIIHYSDRNQDFTSYISFCFFIRGLIFPMLGNRSQLLFCWNICTEMVFQSKCQWNFLTAQFNSFHQLVECVDVDVAADLNRETTCFVLKALQFRISNIEIEYRQFRQFFLDFLITINIFIVIRFIDDFTVDFSSSIR